MSCLATKRPKTRSKNFTEEDDARIINIHNFISNIRDYFINKIDPSAISRFKLDNISTKVCELYRVSESTVYRAVRKQMRIEESENSSPGANNNYLVLSSESRERPKKPPKYICDTFNVSMIRRITQDFYIRKEYPSLTSLWEKCRENDNFPKISRTLFRKWLLVKCKFKYKKINKKPVFLERSDIVAQRENYLRSIRQYRKENYKIYYSDETWCSPDQTRNNCWQFFLTDEERRDLDPFWSGTVLQDMNNFVGGFLVKSGNGRVIINHIGSEEGFLEGGDDVFISKKDTKDYHGNMDHIRYLEWFKKILELVPTKSVLVLDQAPYHRKRVEGTFMPNMGWLKQKIIDWILLHDIPLPSGISNPAQLTKSSLIELAKTKPVKAKFIVEELAEQCKKNVKVLWLPPAHCEFNPIELIWATVKGFVSKNNTGTNLKGIYDLCQKSISRITPEMWRNCVKHSKKYEDSMWDRDRLVDELSDTLPQNSINRIIVPLNGSDTDSDTEDDSEDDCN